MGWSLRRIPQRITSSAPAGIFGPIRATKANHYAASSGIRKRPQNDTADNSGPRPNCLLAFHSDFRYLRNREDNPWSPRARLFPQRSEGDCSIPPPARTGRLAALDLTWGLVGPGVAALEGKIIRVGHGPPFQRLGIEHLIGDALVARNRQSLLPCCRTAGAAADARPRTTSSPSAARRDEASPAQNQEPRPWYLPGLIAWRSWTACRCARTQPNPELRKFYRRSSNSRQITSTTAVPCPLPPQFGATTTGVPEPTTRQADRLSGSAPTWKSRRPRYGA